MDLTPFKTRTKLLTLYRPQVETLRRGEDPFPVHVEVNLSDVCNQKCSWCVSEAVRDEPIQLDLEAPGVARFFADFAKFGGRAIGWSGGGEPTTHRHFTRALHLVHGVGLAQGLLTNGAFDPALVPAIARYCSWVRISVDTHDPVTYRKRRAAASRHYSLVLENARSLVQHGSNVGLNMNVAEWNAEDIEPLYDLACELGVSYLQVRPMLPTPFTRGDDRLAPATATAVLERVEALAALRSREDRRTEIIVSRDKFEDIYKHDGGRTDKSTGYLGCQAHRLFVVLNANGEVTVCMYHLFDRNFVFGNVYEHTLEEIWHSVTRQTVLKRCARLDHPNAGCQVCCKGHEINKVLYHEPIALKAEAVAETSPFL